MSTPRPGQRLLVAGLLAGLAIGAAVGATSLIGASSGDQGGSRPTVLHISRVLADPGIGFKLTAGLFCPGPGSCQAERATAHLLPTDGAGWTEVAGVLEGPGYLFQVPGELVGDDGLAYWLEFRVAGGDAIRLPEGGSASPFRIVTTAGLRESSWPGGLDWSRIHDSSSTVARLGYGRGAGEVGRVGGHGDEQALGPSSFDVAADGSLYVADWVNGRVLVLSRAGLYRRAVPLPMRRPVDLAVGPRGELAVTTLGLRAIAFELGSDGRVVGRYEVGVGVAERIALTPGGPQVWVGPAQWAPVRSRPGVALPAEAQARSLAAAVPDADGSVALSQDLEDGRVAFVWTRPDGSRAGAVLQMPAGVEAGVDYFVRGLPDGGAIAARGFWSEGNAGVGILRFAADGRITSASLIATPSHEMDAAASAVRFRAPDEVLTFHAGDDGIRIERVEVTAR